MNEQLQKSVTKIDYRKYPVAIVGCGKFGKIHLKELLALGADVRYICNRTNARFDELTWITKNRGIYFTTDYDYVLNDSSVSIVVIATGPHEHYELVKKALNAGKHVVCEKPFVFEVEQCNELYTLAKEKSLNLFVHYSDVFTEWNLPYLNEIRQRIANQEKINITYKNYGNGPLRENYSSVWDYGTHAAAFACFYNFPAFHKRTDYTKIDDARANFVSYFESPNRNTSLTCEFGNGFPDRQRVITMSVPSDIIPKCKDPLKIGITLFKDLKDSKSIPYLYSCLFHDIENNSEFINYNNLYHNLSLSITTFCIFIEKGTKLKSNAN